MGLGKIVGRSGRFMYDFLTGIPSSKRLGPLERDVREFFPETILLENGQEIFPLRDTSKSIKSMRKLSIISQSLTTVLGAWVGLRFLNGEYSNYEAIVYGGGIGLAKLGIMGLIHYAYTPVRRAVDIIKSDLNGEEENDSEGEEWKIGTDYPLSEDLD